MAPSKILKDFPTVPLDRYKQRSAIIKQTCRNYYFCLQLEFISFKLNNLLCGLQRPLRSIFVKIFFLQKKEEIMAREGDFPSRSISGPPGFQHFLNSRKGFLVQGYIICISDFFCYLFFCCKRKPYSSIVFDSVHKL